VQKCRQSAHHDGTCCISRLEEASGHWLTSSANRRLCHVCSTVGRTRNDKMHEKCRVGVCILGVSCTVVRRWAIQYLSVIVRKNSYYWFCNVSYQHRLHVAIISSKATDLENYYSELFVS
jgi:hypothetical protein